jgi:hypothetical protein
VTFEMSISPTSYICQLPPCARSPALLCRARTSVTQVRTPSRRRDSGPRSGY